MTTTLGLRVDALDEAAVLHELSDATARGHGLLVTFVNPAALALARRNPEYGRDIARFDIVAPDGMGMSRAVSWLHGVAAQRLSFDNTSLAPLVFAHAMRSGLSVVLIGGRDGVAARAAARLRRHFTTLRLVAAFDGYGSMEEKIATICDLAPAIVVCGMGAGAQERFLLRLRAAGWCGVGFTCGGFLDQLQAGYHYYPKWVDAAGLRWAYRLLREPRRLWRRYLIDYGWFGLCLCGALLGKGGSMLAIPASGRRQP